MKLRRHRWLREETVAPWLVLAVILVVWWVGASLIDRNAVAGSAGTITVVEETPLTNGPSREPAVVAAAPVPGDPPHGATPPSTPVGADPGTNVLAFGTTVLVPVLGADVSKMDSTFDDARGGGARRHEAMDILAPRGTPVLAAVDGRVVKLFTSATGGTTLYQFDEAEQLCYYYAHLDRYEEHLVEGQKVTRGQVIGYVGITGNAPPDTPHLHFAVFKLGADKKWWEGEPIDPLPLMRTKN